MKRILRPTCRMPIPFKNKFMPLVVGPAFVFYCLLSGCSLYSAFPVTLKELKDYVFGQQQSFSFSLDEVLEATVFSVGQTDFVVYRIEHFNRKGLVQARWQDTSVAFYLETVTPSLTKVSSKIHRGKAYREYSSEAALFNDIQDALQDKQKPTRSELVQGMVTVHISQDETSTVVAYLGQSVSVDIIKEESSWVKIALMDGCSGFISKKHLKPAR